MPWITFVKDVEGEYKKGYACDVSELEAKRQVARGVAVRGKHKLKPESVVRKDDDKEIAPSTKSKRFSKS